MMPSPLSHALRVRIERWPIAGSFTISRGAKTEAAVVVAELTDGSHTGRGECVPYARYGETVEGVASVIEGLRPALADGLDRVGLPAALPAGAARNALDCAFWDIEAKRAGLPAHVLAGIAEPRPLVTAYTISLGTPDEMAWAAGQAARHALLKVKLGGHGDPARIAAVRGAVPSATLIADANEGWDADCLSENLAACAEAGVALVEQPLPAGNDAILAHIGHPIPICADESVHDRTSLAGLRGKYDAVNVKLDKTGGLTEALALAAEAKAAGFELMVGCMVATSLAIAPAMLVAQCADVVDLDGAWLLARDRPHGLHYADGLIHPAGPPLWG
jgi:L-alanine-DL-glutamate epimerase-like enolase superfamily enzyme